MSTPLRRMLAEGVAARRAEETARAAATPAGAFDALRGVDFIHFSTVGRRTGRPHRKFWGPYAIWGDVLYSVEEVGTDADWVKNILANPAVEVWGAREPDGVIHATGRIVTSPAEAELGRRLVVERIPGEVWALDHGLVIAFDATPPGAGSSSD